MRVLRATPDPLKRSLKKIPFARKIAERMYRGAGNRVVAIPNSGFSLELDLRSPTQRGYATTDSGETHVTSFLTRQLNAGDHVIDIGGYVGYITMWCADAVGPNGRVTTFEPTPENAASIERSAEANGFHHVEVVTMAVSDRSGNAKLGVTLEEGGRPSSTSALGSSANEGAIEVRTTTLDSFVGDDVSRVDLVKIDVEGAELNVLAGMEKVLKRFRPVLVIELNDDPSLEACSKWLRTHSYSHNEIGRTRHGVHIAARPDGT